MMDSTLYLLVLSLLFWCGLAAVWGYSSHGIFKENRQIKEETPTLPTLNYMLGRLATLQKRNLQLWCAVTVLFVLCAVSNIVSIIHSITPSAAQPVQVVTQPPPVNSQQQPVEKTIAVQAAQIAKKPDAQLPANPVPSANSLPYSDITEFNEKDSKQQAMIDWLKQRYENTLITYYYLQKCNMADKGDFDIIRASLHKELTDLNTETSSAEDNILMAANGSYNELYAQASCADDRVKVTKSSYDSFMQQLRQPKPVVATSPAPNAASPQTR